MKIIRLEENANGTWTAYIYSSSYTGTKEQCESWIKYNCPGEY